MKVAVGDVVIINGKEIGIVEELVPSRTKYPVSYRTQMGRTRYKGNPDNMKVIGKVTDVSAFLDTVNQDKMDSFKVTLALGKMKYCDSLY